jgi:hypothetical protein
MALANERPPAAEISQQTNHNELWGAPLTVPAVGLRMSRRT